MTQVAEATPETRNRQLAKPGDFQLITLMIWLYTCAPLGGTRVRVPLLPRDRRCATGRLGH